MAVCWIHQPYLKLNANQRLLDASSISAALIGQQSWYDYFGLTPDSSYTNAILGAINGVYAAGGAFGCVFNMWSSEYFGRKRSIQIGCCISIVGATIMTASVAIPMFIVSRFVSVMSLYLSSMSTDFLDHGVRHRCPGYIGTALPE